MTTGATQTMSVDNGTLLPSVMEKPSSRNPPWDFRSRPLRTVHISIVIPGSNLIKRHGCNPQKVHCMPDQAFEASMTRAGCLVAVQCLSANKLYQLGQAWVIVSPACRTPRKETRPPYNKTSEYNLEPCRLWARPKARVACTACTFTCYTGKLSPACCMTNKHLLEQVTQHG